MDDSAFASKIGTNYAATDDEVVQLLELLSEPTAKLAKLQEEIDCVYSTYTDLCNQHNALSRKIEDHRALMSPIRRLPIDIIQEIFLHCLPTEYNPIMSRSDCPMLLTQICSGWRSIVHTTPLLWSSIHIVIPSQINHTYYPPSPPWEPSPSQTLTSLEIAKKRAAGIKEWLGRSGECALDISIYDRERATLESLYDIILDAIIGFSQRWDTINFQTPSTNLGRVAAMSEGDVPRLRSLSIRGQDVHNNFNPPGTEPEFDPKFLIDSGLLKAPQLRDISYTRVTEDFAKFPLRWSQLTSISLTGFAWTAPQNMSLFKIAHILQSCPQLITCMLEVTHIASSDSPECIHIGSIPLPCLESISLQGSRGDLTSLFEALQVPCLEELEFFTNHNNISDSFTDQLVAFLNRTTLTLRKLTIDPFFLTKEQLQQCLRACPRLTLLSLRPSHYAGHEVWTPHPHPNALGGEEIAYTLDDDLLRSLIPREDTTDTLLPDLEIFECFVDGRFSDPAIVDFIKAKRSDESGATLKSIAIGLGRPQTLPMVEELRQYVKAGLDCRLSYTPVAVQGPYPASDGIFSPYSSSAFRPWGLLVF